MSTMKKRGRPQGTPAISIHPSAPHDTSATVCHFGTSADGHAIISTQHIFVASEEQPPESAGDGLPNTDPDGSDSFVKGIGYVHYIGTTSERKWYKASVSEHSIYLPYSSTSNTLLGIE
jgi:hypothetical protein